MKNLLFKEKKWEAPLKELRKFRRHRKITARTRRPITNDQTKVYSLLGYHGFWDIRNLLERSIRNTLECSPHKIQLWQERRVIESLANNILKDVTEQIIIRHEEQVLK